MPGRVFTPEFKFGVVKAILSGEKTNTQVCREHQIAESVVVRWKREYAQKGEAAFSAKTETTSNAQPEVETLNARIIEVWSPCQR